MPNKSIREMTDRERARYSLAARTFHAVLILSLIICTAAVWFGFSLYRNSVNRECRRETWNISQTVYGALDKTGAEEKAREILSVYDSLSDEEKKDGSSEEYLMKYSEVMDERFEKLCAELQELKEINNAAAVYIAAADQTAGRMIFLAGSGPADSFRAPGSYDLLKQKDLEALLYGAEENMIDRAFGTDERIPSVIDDAGKYGSRCTAGTVLGGYSDYIVMVLADTDMSRIVSGSRHFLIRYILVLAVVSVAAGWLMVRHLKKTVVAPINRLAEAAASYSADKNAGQALARHFDKVSIATGDEIENLSYVLKDMENDMFEYAGDLNKVTAEKERIGTELGLATKIQADMLPNIFPAFPERSEFDIYANMKPAKEVGGDFYDFFLIDDDHLAAVIADVSGKGIPAALFMMVTKILVQNITMSTHSPGKVLEAVNRQICANNREEMFVTAWMAVLNLRNGVLTAANAGHEYPVIKKKDGMFEIIKDNHGLVIGAMPDTKYKEYRIQTEPGDIVFVYTDGVIEAENAEGEQFGIDRTIRALNMASSENPEEILKKAHKAVDDFVREAPQFDDMTMLCIKYLGSAVDEHSGESANMKQMSAEAKKENIAAVTAFVDEVLEANGCPLKAQMQIDVAVDEVFANISEYAYAPKTGTATVGIEILDNPKRAVLTFIDQGIPYNPMTAKEPDVTLTAEEREVGGLGIFLVRKTMDDIQYEYRDGSNILKISKNIE